MIEVEADCRLGWIQQMLQNIPSQAKLNINYHIHHHSRVKAMTSINLNQQQLQPTPSNNESSPLIPSNSPSPASNRPENIRAIFSDRLCYYIPALDWIPQYSRGDLFNDTIAGLTLASLLIPQSIGYASNLAGIPSINGLFSAAIPAIVYPLLCTGRHVSVGPEAALSLLVGHVIKQAIAHRQTHSGLQPPTDAELLQLSITISTLLTFQTGLIAFSFGFFRLGFLDAVLSKALLRGFVTAIAVVIAIEQLPSLLGLAALEKEQAINAEGSIEKLIWTLANLRQSHKLSCLISLTAFLLLLSIRTFKSSKFCRRKFPGLKYLPEILITAAIASFVTDLCNWDQKGVAVLGSISISEVRIDLPWRGVSKKLVKDTLGTAFTLCICGLVDSIVAAKGEAARFHYSISANRELVALGAANIATSFVMGDMPELTFDFPILVLVSHKHMARSPRVVVISLVVFNLFAELPEDFMFFWNLGGWTELALMTTTFLLTLVYDIKTGIPDFRCNATAMRVRILGRDPITRTWEPIDTKKTESEEVAREIEEEIPGVLIVKIRESLSFANVGGLKERLRRLEMFGYKKRHPSAKREREDTRMIVFHLGDVDKIDVSALQILKEILQEYIDRHVIVWICHIKPSRYEVFKKAGIVSVVGEDRFLANVNQVLETAQSNSLISIGHQEMEILLTDENDEYLPS
ncbi:uncharacterized protein PGTG_14477 [Puccinia graminis f. sp. tritici CRL 75-36-700-3]|uniref:STAS domain-containing protein n=1 Tax=Puccinia graminis f. sp. tritici (strain CRL 75-36-700-3 / race SCCL) TaxID=418459 RepID=E3KVQ3_PUCGT|nr:uncharacterized protein PGTG_14477 [Puccinia graminis f. sp. tritici CRL 75-36-700-3]EFP88393.2 hypothetical protein PGTG_14477 [Puccinia graminis f. sp. tritici CRL 75-36-700-3]